MEPSDSDEQWDDWSELWEYIRMPGQTTGLGYDIHVDNNKAYQTYGHELWLYVSCDGIKIPVTIEDQPKVKCVVDEDQYDLSTNGYSSIWQTGKPTSTYSSVC